MTIDMQTLNDALIAIFVTVGIAVAVSILAIAAEAVHLRSKNRTQTTAHSSHVTDTEDSRQLILR
jgi:Kef-type K+ transport system membrane component KefB